MIVEKLTKAPRTYTVKDDFEEEAVLYASKGEKDRLITVTKAEFNARCDNDKGLVHKSS